MVRHVVVLTWNDGVDDATRERFCAALDDLQREIDVIRDYRFGTDLGLTGSTADFVICADFDSAADYETYRDHPAHAAFRAEHLAPNVASRSAAQFTW